jgi:hypothetical protein
VFHEMTITAREQLVGAVDYPIQRMASLWAGLRRVAEYIVLRNFLGPDTLARTCQILYSSNLLRAGSARLVYQRSL